LYVVLRTVNSAIATQYTEQRLVEVGGEGDDYGLGSGLNLDGLVLVEEQVSVRLVTILASGDEADERACVVIEPVVVASTVSEECRNTSVYLRHVDLLWT